MTPPELGQRILAACNGRTMTEAGDMRAVLNLLTWLQRAIASDAGLFGAASRRAVAYHRETLRKAQLAPAENPFVLAEVAEELAIPSANRSALMRLAWLLRGRTGRVTWVGFQHRAGADITKLQEILAGWEPLSGEDRDTDEA